MISENQLDEAVKELTVTLSGTQPRSDIGFVVGYILLCENRAEEAGEVYSEILRRDPDFPELHTRLSATYFQTGNPEETLREAKAAIALNPDNPAAHGADNTRLAVPLTSLCNVYDQWGKPEKSEPCHARSVALAETQFGANSPYLVRDLTAEADALRKLGRADEAAKLELRTQAIQSTQANSN